MGQCGNGPNGNNGDVYDKLRMLNGSQPWSTHHPSAWYMPAAAAAAVAAASFMGNPSGAPGSPSSSYMLSHQHGQIDMMGDVKKGQSFFPSSPILCSL